MAGRDPTHGAQKVSRSGYGMVDEFQDEAKLETVHVKMTMERQITLARRMVVQNAGRKWERKRAAAARTWDDWPMNTKYTKTNR